MTAGSEAGARLESTERYYDLLRARIDGWLSRHAGPAYGDISRILFLVPDVFALVLRLAQDPRVALVNRLKLWGLAVYILSPVDINIDFILPFGPLDDIILSVIVLDSVLGTTLAHVVQENWPGDEDAIHKLRVLTQAVTRLRRRYRRARPSPGRL